MEKVRFAFLGMGDRGTVYAAKVLLHPEEARRLFLPPIQLRLL